MCGFAASAKPSTDMFGGALTPNVVDTGNAGYMAVLLYCRVSPARKAHAPIGKC
jgi:hypothetical protein